MDKEYCLSLVSKFDKETNIEKNEEFDNFLKVNESFVEEINEKIPLYLNIYRGRRLSKKRPNMSLIIMFHFYLKLKEKGFDTENPLSLVVFYDWTDEELMKNNNMLSEGATEYLRNRRA